jgi:hypothetical protein
MLGTDSTVAIGWAHRINDNGRQVCVKQAQDSNAKYARDNGVQNHGSA